MMSNDSQDLSKKESVPVPVEQIVEQGKAAQKNGIPHNETENQIIARLVSRLKRPANP